MSCVRIKICGITNPADAAMAAEAGADALGFVFWKKSPRYVAPSTAAAIIGSLPPFVTAVGVFVNELPERIVEIAVAAGLGCVQLHGDENPGVCGTIKASVVGLRLIKAFRVSKGFDIMSLKPYSAQAYLLDAYKAGVPGGTGQTFDWEVAVKAKEMGRIILSGGLTPSNVAEAVREVRPYAVDVSSGVERSPGLKDADKVVRFIEAAKGALGQADAVKNAQHG